MPDHRGSFRRGGRQRGIGADIPTVVDNTLEALMFGLYSSQP